MTEISLFMTLDLDELVEQLGDYNLRKISEASGYDNGAQNAVAEAANLRRQGRCLDADTLIERQFYPKWRSKDARRVSYNRAMGVFNGAHS